MNTEIEVSVSKELCPACNNLLRWLIATVLKAFGVNDADYTIGIRTVSDEQLIRETEDG